MKYLKPIATVITSLIVTTSLYGATAGFDDTSANIIRTGGTTSLSTDLENETYTVEANGGGKVAIGFEGISGSQVGSLSGLKFSSVGSTSEGFPYVNFWVTDGTNYAFVALNEVYSNGGMQDGPVYEQAVSEPGIDRNYFQSLQIRLYGTNTSDIDWVYDGATRNKFNAGSWGELWKSSDTGVVDPVTVADIAHLTFASPFTSENANIPSVSSPAAWTYAGTGDPQQPEAFYVVVGDTTASNTGDFIIGDLELNYEAAAQNSTSGGATADSTSVGTGTGTVNVGGSGSGYFATDSTEVDDAGTLEVSASSTFQTKTINTGVLGTIVLVDESEIEAEGGDIAGTLELGTTGKLKGGNDGLLLSGNVNGSGTLQNLTITGDVSVGNSPGVQNYEGVIFGAESSILLEIEGTDPSEYDRIIADGDTDFSGADLSIVFSESFTPEDTDTFDLFTGDALLIFNSIITPEGWTFNPENGQLVIPEPGTLPLLLGVGSLLLIVRRRQRA